MTRLLLIGLLTVLSFSVFSFDEQPIKPWVEPKKVPTDLGSCDLYYGNDPTSLVSFTDCKSQAETTSRAMGSAAQWDMGGITTQAFDYYGSPAFWVFLEVRNTSGGKVTAAKWVKQQSSTSDTCPPDGLPDYNVGPVQESPENPTHMVCKPKFAPCPLGFYKSEVTLSSGVSQCVKIQCPSRGTRVNNVFNHDGILKVGSSGTYCDGKCSYTIQGGDVPYNNSSFSFGTSNGFVCGQGDTDKVKFTPTDKENDCQTHQLSSGDIYQECTQGEGTSPEDDNAEGELSEQAQDASVDPSVEPNKYQGADCSMSADKLYCVGTEIIEALDHQTSETKKQQDEKHNKLVKLQKEISEYVETQERERETRRSKQSQSETGLIVERLTGIETAVTGLGTGSGGIGGTPDSDSLIEQFDPDSLLSKFSGDLDSINQKINDANSDLDSKLDDGLSKFNDSDSIWNPFKDIPTYLPAEYTCQPFTLGLDEHPLVLDLCEYEELIKNVIGFIFIMLTALRLFYQSQVIIRNSAIGSA